MPGERQEVAAWQRGSAKPMSDLTTPVRQVLTGGTVVTMNPQGDVFSPGILVIEDGQITHVGPESTAPAHGPGTIVDCRGCLLMPGLINAHTHTCMALFRGLREDRPRDAWMPAYTLPYQNRAQPEDYYWGTLLGGLEMLQNGITCVADRFGHMDVIAEAMEAVGIRAVVCQTLFDVDRTLELGRALALIERWGVSPEHRVHCGLGPHAPDTCSDWLLRRIRGLAHETGARIFIHCAQSEAELVALKARGHSGAVRCLRTTGVLGPDVIAAHCIYVDEEEMRLLADFGAWVAHCPTSNAKIEAQVAPMTAMLQAGVAAALGTDWAPSNNGMDLFDEMKAAGLLNKVASGDPTAMPVSRLLSMATLDGARALGMDALVGSLEVRKRADVIALAMEGLHLQPWHSIEAALVYSAKGHDVRHVWVDGQWLVRDRRPTHLDASAVVDEVTRIWRRLKAVPP
jgi:5-methylthioadenosine/S-adenosylhomocysteine deaminase